MKLSSLGTQDSTRKKDLRVKLSPVKVGYRIYTLQDSPLSLGPMPSPSLQHHEGFQGIGPVLFCSWG